MSFVDDDAVSARLIGTDQITRDLIDRLLCRRQTRRTNGRSATCCSRSSESARCAPRRVPMTAWISSTMTVLTVRSICRLRSEVSSRYSDSGVVTRMCGGVRMIAARSEDVVSPVRTAAVIGGMTAPAASARS